MDQANFILMNLCKLTQMIKLYPHQKKIIHLYVTYFYPSSQATSQDTDIIKVCLKLGSRSPKPYKDLLSSGVLILPSRRGNRMDTIPVACDDEFYLII